MVVVKALPAEDHSTVPAEESDFTDWDDNVLQYGPAGTSVPSS